MNDETMQRLMYERLHQRIADGRKGYYVYALKPGGTHTTHGIFDTPQEADGWLNSHHDDGKARYPSDAYAALEVRDERGDVVIAY